jgi:hypothetical protein
LAGGPEVNILNCSLQFTVNSGFVPGSIGLDIGSWESTQAGFLCDEARGVCKTGGGWGENEDFKTSKYPVGQQAVRKIESQERSQGSSEDLDAKNKFISRLVGNADYFRFSIDSIRVVW